MLWKRKVKVNFFPFSLLILQNYTFFKGMLYAALSWQITVGARVQKTQ
jgi:hypothetical protein